MGLNFWKEIKQLKVERDLWKDDARLYLENSMFWSDRVAQLEQILRENNLPLPYPTVASSAMIAGTNNVSSRR